MKKIRWKGGENNGNGRNKNGQQSKGVGEGEILNDIRSTGDLNMSTDLNTLMDTVDLEELSQIEVIAEDPKAKEQNEKATKATQILLIQARDNVAKAVQSLMNGENGFGVMGMLAADLTDQLFPDGTDNGTKTRRATRQAQEGILKQSMDAIVYRMPVTSGSRKLFYGILGFEETTTADSKQKMLLFMARVTGLNFAYAPLGIKVGDCWNAKFETEITDRDAIIDALTPAEVVEEDEPEVEETAAEVPEEEPSIEDHPEAELPEDARDTELNNPEEEAAQIYESHG